MDAATGAVRWQQPTGTGQSTVTVRAGIVFDTDENGHLYAVDAASGSVLWDHANQAAGG
jgi:outer membrane protein assembly factor BamB